MKVMPDNYTIMFDVDECLIECESVPEDYQKQDGEIILEHPVFGKLKVFPIYEMIETLKNKKLEGATITVWHKGGTQWSSKVIKALKLTKYVDLIVAKPDLYYDDEPADYVLHTKGEIDE
jgi:predicted phosphatase